VSTRRSCFIRSEVVSSEEVNSRQVKKIRPPRLSDFYMMETLRYALDTGLHLRSNQIIARASRRLRYRFLYPWAAERMFAFRPENESASPEPCVAFDEAGAARLSDRQAILSKADDLMRNRFEFLNLAPVDLPFPIDWDIAPDGDGLWQYNLHYGEWAIPLVQAYLLTSRAEYRDCMVRLLLDWIDRNPPGRQPGWDPYPISRRVIAWSRVATALVGDPLWLSFWRDHLSMSLRQQAKLLAANLESDLLNNHLLANYRALAWVGLLFPSWPESREFTELGLNGLWSEMRRQVLPDGVHDERSISYHTIVLQDLLETWWLASKRGVRTPDDVPATLLKMMEFLSATRAPDGAWPMVNDSVPGYPVDPGIVLKAGVALLGKGAAVTGNATSSYLAWFGLLPAATAGSGVGEALSGIGMERANPAGAGNLLRSKTAEVLPPAKEFAPAATFLNAGYAVLRDGDDGYLFFDAGPLGPERMPGHGHADALSIVLYGNGRPMIVDPGVYTYRAGQWRDHFRSTSAHNTVTVDAQDQCVFWGPFRVAYPVAAKILDHSSTHVTGQHEGYRRLSPPLVHRRRVELTDRGRWSIFDRFEGSGRHEFNLTLQLAEAADAQIDGLVCRACWPDGSILQIDPVSAPEKALASVENDWVSPAWNVKIQAPRYCLRWVSNVPSENSLILTVN
jgi:uncharacterized heparinase superfamily protein